MNIHLLYGGLIMRRQILRILPTLLYPQNLTFQTLCFNFYHLAYYIASYSYHIVQSSGEVKFW